MNSRTVERRQAWIDLGLYWEHAWTADGPVSRDARRDWQRGLAVQIETYVDNLQSDALSTLGGMIQRTGSETRFYVFNPLSWTRTDIADIPYTELSPVHVIDLSTNQEAPSQIVTIDGERRLRILAQNVPAVGYKVFEIHAGIGQSFSQAAVVNGGDIENQFYKAVISGSGAITSLIDKANSDREFVRIINGRAVNDLGPGQGTLQVENAGPVTVTILATCSTPLAHTSRITYVRDSRRIEIRNDINQNFNDVYTWGFGFDLNTPDIWHEEVGAIIRAKLLAQGGHYSPKNARYDWLTLNHFADTSSGGIGITLSNQDCYYMKLGSSTPDFLDTSTPQISVLVGGQVDGPSLGIPNQGGDNHFLQRFALQTHSAYDPVAAMKFALEHQNPLVAGWVTGGSDYPETQYALFNISSTNVLLWSLKPAEDGIQNGIITRFWNPSFNNADLNLSYPSGSIQEASQLSHIETPLAMLSLNNGAFADILSPHQFKTYSIKTSGMPATTNPVHLPLVERQ